MLMTLNRIAGMPVVCGGRQIGQVERAVADAENAVLHGLVVRRGIGAAKWLPASGLEWIGEVCVAARKKPCPLPAKLPPCVSHVYLANGNLAGTVADMVLCSHTFRILALEISPGPLYGLAGKTEYARQFSVRGGDGQVMVAHLCSWAQISSTLEEETE